ncbi:MAG: tRNA 2-thiouridine(34) synthase MnmA [Thermodesulfobacteriota bacterium]|nr:MAG: tRNA 2-thiouridine(34) synthase MnmA [Thermodesulfobacteriota bacterium]
MTSKKKKIVVAMSGGVDSSAALAILKEDGYDCIGVSMQLWDYSKKEDAAGAAAGSCCSLDDIHDARAVADRLDVPFYVLNLEKVFSREVVDYFVSSYLSGATPNPCIKCNEKLKFDALLKKARTLGAELLATGHYARIINVAGGGEDGTGPRLLKGVDDRKDQSYFLFTMTGEQLSNVVFPLGGLTKQEVRAYARKAGLKTSEKKESQEICFVEDGDYAGFMAAGLSDKAAGLAGEIVNSSGLVLGSHRGLFNYTIGQRKGLNLSGGPFYVTAMDREKNRLIVGPVGELFSEGLMAGEINWINREYEKAFNDKGLKDVTVKVRYRHSGVLSAITPAKEGRLKVDFTEPVKAVTPGQAVVFYSGDEVIGGGWIERAIK